VGAFASSNLGDVSPNTKGPICIDTGEECDFVTSTCNGEAKTCIAFGPGDNMVESTSIIAGKLLDKAKARICDGYSWVLILVLLTGAVRPSGARGGHRTGQIHTSVCGHAQREGHNHFSQRY
jgi:hypothetical protein